MGEIDKCLLQTLQAVTVGLHVISVDIGNHRQRRRQMQEGRVGLIGLRHQKLTGAEPCVGTSRQQAATNDEGGIEATLGEYARHQRGGGRLAVSARDGDATLHAHQLGEHQGTRHHRQLGCARGNHLGIRFRNGG